MKCYLVGGAIRDRLLSLSFSEKDFVVIGVSSNDFNQELQNKEDVKKFCEVNFGINFPMTDITNVKGENAHPFFKWANVTTGFKPRFLVVKRTDVVDNWAVFDSARNLNNDLKWNTSEAEGSAPVEFLSDGFQLKNTYGSTNANGGCLLYTSPSPRDPH